MYQDGLSGIRPRFSVHNDEWANAAQDALPATSWGYVHGSAGMRRTDDNNLAAFKKWGIGACPLSAMRTSI